MYRGDSCTGAKGSSPALHVHGGKLNTEIQNSKDLEIDQLIFCKANDLWLATARRVEQTCDSQYQILQHQAKWRFSSELQSTHQVSFFFSTSVQSLTTETWSSYCTSLIYIYKAAVALPFQIFDVIWVLDDLSDEKMPASCSLEGADVLQRTSDSTEPLSTHSGSLIYSITFKCR